MNEAVIGRAREIIAGDGYAERVYAGLLGKVIGVYLGRPFEGWSYDRIQERLGDVEYYVHDEVGVPLIVTDDDIAGTLTFIRAVEDSGRGFGTTAVDVAECWLNYLIEGRSVLWWGGVGNSTEHTAYMRLKDGYGPPYSGSMELNGKTVAEQIGAQIFIDGWAMISPGAPQLAAELARRAATVSHDGEAVYGAQMLAAMEAMAFLTSDVDALLEAGLGQIPGDSIIARMIGDIREWHRTEPDWRAAREKLEAHFGYELYGGNCHIVPNHGLIVLALLYGAGDFARSMMIVNTAGWDTDCNSGNLGCLLGLMHGLDGIDAGPDWRGPVADRLYVPTADSGSGITDVVSESLRITNIARVAVGLQRVAPKGGARFHFSFPGSMQGFALVGSGRLENSASAEPGGGRGLAIIGTGPLVVSTPTFIPPGARTMPTSYALDVSPIIYSGQQLETTFFVPPGEGRAIERVAPFLRHYNGDDELVDLRGPHSPAPEGWRTLRWTIPDLAGQPIAEVGLAVDVHPRVAGRLYLDRLHWGGTPKVTLRRPPDGGSMWRRAWVGDLYGRGGSWPDSFRLIANTSERRFMIIGAPDWRDYAVEAALTPHMAEAMGLAARVQGLRRHYLLRCDHRGEMQLIKRDGREQVLARAPFPWHPEESVRLRLEVRGGSIQAYVDGDLLISVLDEIRPLESGGVAVACEMGRVRCDEVRVEPHPGSSSPLRRGASRPSAG
jgi:ADP-ribosylglycohydrolase